MIKSIADLQSMKELYQEKMGQYKHLAMVCYGTGCMSSGCKDVRDALVEELEKAAKVAENDSQRKYISDLVAYYRSGDLKLWDRYNIEWLQDTVGTVDFVNGFVEASFSHS